MLWERIEAGALTGVALAVKTGFRQGYISNFLNRKRGLSIAGIDRIMEAEGLSLHDLPDTAVPDPEYVSIPVVEPEHALEPNVALFAAERVKFKRDLLDAMRPSVLGSRRWSFDRWMLFRPDEEDCALMAPRLPANCTVLIDRHYNSLEVYRQTERATFAVNTNEGVVIRYADAARGELVLRAHDPRDRAQTISVPTGKEFHDLVVGRVAWVGAEL